MGQQAEVPIIGRHRDKRILTGVLNIQTGTFFQCFSQTYTQTMFQAILQLIRRHWRGWHIVLFLDRISAQWAKSSRRLARELGIELRCLIQDISLDSFSQPGQTLIQIRWQTGAVTPHTVSRPTAADGHRLDATLVALIRELAQTRPDDQVAEILNQRGLKTQQHLPWSYRLVMETRRRHQIPTACPITPRGSAPRGDGLISLKAAAQCFDTHPNTILLWARKGILYSEHKPGMCPIWMRVTPDDFARLTQVTAPSDSMRIRQACKVLQLSEAQLSHQVKAGRYTVCRVQQNQHWEFRIIAHPDLIPTSGNRCVSPHIRGAV